MPFAYICFIWFLSFYYIFNLLVHFFRRKKKCIRYLDSNDPGEPESEDNLGSAGSVEAPTPESPDTDHSLDNHVHEQLHPKPPSPSSPSESKPRLDTDGSVIPPSPRPPSRHHQPHNLYHHHPLSVHHLIQPHFGRLTERFQQDSAAPTHMLTVTWVRLYLDWGL